ncbi:MAG: signal peptidase I, partial [Planctomycetota bacterium]
EVPAFRGPLVPPARFSVDKVRGSKRWDLVVFRYPVDPTTYYVKRVVGMPGERVEIREGGIWINGKWAALPRELAGLEYTDGSQGGYRPPEFVTSWQLTDNEYIVLGDFSAKSSDSRLWGPVPTENMVGVVQCIYWPPARCRWFE